MAGEEISCVIVKDFSRFGRNLIEVGNYLDQVFPFLGVRFIAVNENYDSEDRNGCTIGLDVSLRAMVYEMYSRDLSRKISSVKEGKMHQGRYTGSFSFFGYQRMDSAASGLAADPLAAVVVKRIFSLAANGTKPKQIAIMLNQEGIPSPFRYRKQRNPNERYQCPTATAHTVWTRARIAAILKDERYTGVLVSKKRIRLDLSTNQTQAVKQENWVRTENALEPIISKEQYMHAQKIFSRQSSRQNTAYPSEMFRGLLRCAYCEKALDKIPTKTPYFRCSTGIFQPVMPCASVSVKKSDLQSAISIFLRCAIICTARNQQTPGKAASLNPALSNQCIGLNDRIRKCKAEKVILFEQYHAGKIDIARFLDEKQTIADQIDAYYQAKEELRTKISNQSKCLLPKITLEGEHIALQRLTREILTALVKEIRIWQHNRIEIIWNFHPLY